MSEASSFLGQDSLLASNCCYKTVENVYRGIWIFSIYIFIEIVKLGSKGIRRWLDIGQDLLFLCVYGLMINMHEKSIRLANIQPSWPYGSFVNKGCIIWHKQHHFLARTRGNLSVGKTAVSFLPGSQLLDSIWFVLLTQI